MLGVARLTLHDKLQTRESGPIFGAKCLEAVIKFAGVCCANNSWLMVNLLLLAVDSYISNIY